VILIIENPGAQRQTLRLFLQKVTVFFLCPKAYEQAQALGCRITCVILFIGFPVLNVKPCIPAVCCVFLMPKGHEQAQALG
jgi:hypothetical protein